MLTTQALRDGYVECSECGHTIEWDHDNRGCHLVECTCTARWTRDQKRRLRATEGLSQAWPSALALRNAQI